MSLVLDSVDHAFFTPVDFSSVGSAGSNTTGVLGWGLETEDSLVFGWGHSGELVHGNLEGFLASVVFLNKALVSHPNTKAGLVFVTSEELVSFAHP